MILQQLKEKNSSIKLLNMVSETISFIDVNYPKISKVGVLSTTGTYKSGVYSKRLKSKGYEVIVPTKEMQEQLIHTAIYDTTYGIKAFSNPDDKVLDLYAGSGTIGCVARELGRQSISIEVSKESATSAAERITNGCVSIGKSVSKMKHNKLNRKRKTIGSKSKTKNR